MHCSIFIFPWDAAQHFCLLTLCIKVKKVNRDIAVDVVCTVLEKEDQTCMIAIIHGKLYNIQGICMMMCLAIKQIKQYNAVKMSFYYETIELIKLLFW